MKQTALYTFIGGALFTGVLFAQAPAAKPAAPAAASPAAAKEIVLNATSANVKESGTPVKIRIFRWSDEAEKTPIVAALTAPAPGAGGGRPGGGGGRPGGGGGRPGGAPAADGAAPAAGGGRAAAAAGAGAAPAAGGQDAAAGAAAGGRAAGAARGGGGGGRGGRGGDAAPQTPIQRFTDALQKAPTVGYIWTTDVTGYSIKYAVRTAQPDGSEKIVLATDRRLGAYSPAWELKQPGTPTDYEFTVLELHVDAKGGEGKSSLTTKVVADGNTKELALENYASAPAVLTNVKR